MKSLLRLIQRWLGQDRQVSKRVSSFRPEVESLEERRVLSTFTVTNSNDSGAGSLRDAITKANGHINAGGPDRIVFKLGAGDQGHFYYKNDSARGSVSLSRATKTNRASDAANPNSDPDYKSSWWSIRLKSALPAVTDAAVIDGYSQSGAQQNNKTFGTNSILRVELTPDKPQGTVPESGLTLQSNGSTVKGLVINGFASQVSVTKNPANSIVPSNNSVQGNFLGTEVAGLVATRTDPVTIARQLQQRGMVFTVVERRLGQGIQVNAGAGNVIGGNAASARNLISGNAFAGVLIRSSSTSAQANYIGSNRSGDKAIPNGNGIDIFSNVSTAPAPAPPGTSRPPGAVTNVIATQNAAILSNLISGNAGDGINNGGKDAKVQSNLIGTNGDGTRALPNSKNGIIASFTGAAITGNVVSANGNDGLQISGSNNTAQGNFIGLATRTKLVNQKDAVVVGPATAANNKIVGNAIAANTGFKTINDTGTGTVTSPPANRIVP